MNDPLHTELERYAAAFPEHPEWDDVVRRADRARRRVVWVAVVLAAATLIPTAFAFPAVRQVFEGTPAPPPVVRSFQTGNSVAARLPPALARYYGIQRVDPTNAHGVLAVRTLDGPLYLWAAKKRSGDGACWRATWQRDLRPRTFLEGAGAACDRAHPTSRISYSYAWRAPHWSVAVLVGRVYADASTVDVGYGCGQTRSLPVVEHLFMTTFLWGTRVTTLTARDAHGRVTATRRVAWRPSPGGPTTPNRGESCPAPRLLAAVSPVRPSAVLAVALTYWPKANPPGRILAAAKGFKKVKARWHIPLAFITMEGLLPSRFPPSSRSVGCRRGEELEVWFRGGATRIYGPCNYWPPAVQPLGQKLQDELGRFVPGPRPPG